jgi:hypothetical protein
VLATKKGFVVQRTAVATAKKVVAIHSSTEKKVEIYMRMI